MDKTRFIRTIVGGMIGCCICQYFRMKREEKQLKELHDTINKSTKRAMETMEQADINMKSTDEIIKEIRDTQKRIDKLLENGKDVDDILKNEFGLD